MGRLAWAPAVELGPPAPWRGPRRRRTAWHVQHCPARPLSAWGCTRGRQDPCRLLPFPCVSGRGFLVGTEVSEPRAWSLHTGVVALPTEASVARGVPPLVPALASSPGLVSRTLLPWCRHLTAPRWWAARRGVCAGGETCFDNWSGPGLTIASGSGRWSLLYDPFWRVGAVPVIEF